MLRMERKAPACRMGVANSEHVSSPSCWVFAWGRETLSAYSGFSCITEQRPSLCKLSGAPRTPPSLVL